MYCDFMFCCFYVLGSNLLGIFTESGDITVQSINISTFFISRTNNFFSMFADHTQVFPLFVTGQECWFQNWEHYYSRLSNNGFVLMRITSTQAKQDIQLLLRCPANSTSHQVMLSLVLIILTCTMCLSLISKSSFSST